MTPAPDSVSGNGQAEHGHGDGCRVEPGVRRVVILGGGFAGVYAALEFERTLAKDPGIEVTLVNSENFFLFTPMLHEVAASDLDMTNIVNPIRKLLRRVRFFHGEVDGIDLPARTVQVTHGHGRHSHTLPYDHLVLALGSVTNFYNLPGLSTRALTMKSLGDAIYLRNRMIAHLEEANFECASALRTPLLTFVVAGGGFAGVETIAGMNDFLREALRFYPNLRPDMLQVELVHSGEVILPELGARLGRYAHERLTARGVHIRTNTKVTSVTDDAVRLSDGTELTSHTLVWTAGTSPHPLLGALPCEKQGGRICVNEYLEVPGWPGVWALGDCALIPNGHTGGFHPPTAQHALREGQVVARNVTAVLHGGRRQPFAFQTIGQLAAIGRRTGVANVFGFRFSGVIAWALWRAIYVIKLPRVEKKVRVLLDWTLDILFSKDLVQFLTVRGTALSSDEATTVRDGTLSVQPPLSRVNV